MPRISHRNFITLILSAALAVTAVGAPARADGDDLAKALAGIAALAIIGKAIHDSRDDDDKVTHNPPPYWNQNGGYPYYHVPQYPTYKPQPYPARPWPTQPRPLPPQVSRMDLPAQCLRSFEVNRKTVRLLGAPCLKNNYRYSGSLPKACEFSFSNRDGRHTGYEPQCLRQRGYRVAAR